MPGELKYITASCIIQNGVVLKNGKPVFEDRNSNAADFLLSAYRHFKIDYPKFYKMDHLSKLGFLAAEVLITDNFKREEYKAGQLGIVFANANASLDADINYWESVKNIPSPALFVYTLPNIVIGEICIRNNFKGENAFFVQPVFDAEFLQFYVSDLMEKYKLEVCICGWVDIVGEEYKAVLYQVEKKKQETSLIFSTEIINNIYEVTNG